MDMFNEDFGDLKGLISKEDSDNGFKVPVICEGCGFTVVDDEGCCRSKTCLKKHGLKINGEHLDA
jgi:hypothetical protein